jgi:hypothetical protein
MEKVEKQRQAGMAYYVARCDETGYPNGLPYWHEMSASDKYNYCVTGLAVLKRSAELGLIPEIDFWLEDEFGEGDCRRLMDYLLVKGEEEKADFEKRLAALQSVFREDDS